MRQPVSDIGFECHVRSQATDRGQDALLPESRYWLVGVWRMSRWSVRLGTAGAFACETSSSRAVNDGFRSRASKAARTTALGEHEPPCGKARPDHDDRSCRGCIGPLHPATRIFAWVRRRAASASTGTFADAGTTAAKAEQSCHVHLILRRVRRRVDALDHRRWPWSVRPNCRAMVALS